MSKRSRSKSGRNNETFRTDKFVTLDFSDSQKAEISDWIESMPGEQVADVETMVGSGWKISISWSDWFDCYYVSGTCKQEDSEYFDKTYSLKHMDLAKGLLVLQYVILIWAETGKLEDKPAGDAYNW